MARAASGHEQVYTQIEVHEVCSGSARDLAVAKGAVGAAEHCHVLRSVVYITLIDAHSLVGAMCEVHSAPGGGTGKPSQSSMVACPRPWHSRELHSGRDR